MTMPAPARRATTPGRQGPTWLRLMGVAAITEAGLLLVAGVTLRDAETIVFAVVVMAASAWFIWRPNVVPVLIRSLVFADVCFFMATATVANLATHEALAAILLPLALTVVSAVGLISTAGYLRGGANVNAGGRASTAVGLAAVLVMVAGVGVTAVSGSGDPQQARRGDIKLGAHAAKFSATALTAPSGQVTIYASNDDLFWHTVTIDRLRVDVRIPVKGHRRITFTAAPGTYTFYCAIPGHAGIGMKGTLAVR
jgi:plastocyanin